MSIEIVEGKKTDNNTPKKRTTKKATEKNNKKSVTKQKAKTTRKTREKALELWDMQEFETDASYAAFCYYMNLKPSERSVRKAAIASGKNTNSYYENLCTANDWRRRVKAWDRHVEEKARLAALEERKEMEKGHIKIAQLMISKAMEALEKIEYDDLRPRDIVRMMAEASRLERLTRGASTENTEISGKDGSPVQIYLPDNGKQVKEEE